MTTQTITVISQKEFNKKVEIELANLIHYEYQADNEETRQKALAYVSTKFTVE